MEKTTSKTASVSPIRTWSGKTGILWDDSHSAFPTRVFGFWDLEAPSYLEIPSTGAVFGFVSLGTLLVEHGTQSWFVNEGQWFTTANGARVSGVGLTRALLAQRMHYLGLASMGGPIEAAGRLKYIDGCSDTLLSGPPLMGDPCLNLLVFPKNVFQTMHTHPSCRVGIVVAGHGDCVMPSGELPLMPGQIFYIPENAQHCFKTDETEGMSVVAYHPDSDWGPTHEEHPMINRTWVEGRKIDNSDEDRHPGHFIRSKLRETAPRKYVLS